MFKPIWAKTKPLIIAGVAFVLIIIGVLGLFLPFLQGLLFILIGICLLAVVSNKFKLSLYRRLSPYPKVKARAEKIFNKLERFFFPKRNS